MMSFVVPVWNVAPWLLSECIVSIRAVVGQKHEIIVCDDGSEAESAQIYATTCRAAKALFLRSPVHRGMAVMRNWGAAASSGSYLFFVDADDRLAEFDIAELESIALQEPSIIIANHRHISFDMANILSERRKRRYVDLFRTHSTGIEDPFLYATFLFHPMIFRARDFVQAGGFSLAYTSGEEIALQIALTEANPAGVVYYDQLLYLYRKNPRSVVHDPRLYNALIANIEIILGQVASRRSGRDVHARRSGRSRETGAAHYRLFDGAGEELVPTWFDATFEVVRD